MTQQPITTRAEGNRGARNLTRAPGPVQLAVHGQGRLHDVVALGHPMQLEASLCSGEQVSVATSAHAAGQVLQGASPGTGRQASGGRVKRA